MREKSNSRYDAQLTNPLESQEAYLGTTAGSSLPSNPPINAYYDRHYYGGYGLVCPSCGHCPTCGRGGYRGYGPTWTCS